MKKVALFDFYFQISCGHNSVVTKISPYVDLQKKHLKKI